MIIALDIVLLHNDSRGFQILQALQGVTTLRQVLLGIQKQSTAEYPYFSDWLSSNHFPQTHPALHPRIENCSIRIYY